MPKAETKYGTSLGLYVWADTRVRAFVMARSERQAWEALRVRSAAEYATLRREEALGHGGPVRYGAKHCLLVAHG